MVGTILGESSTPGAAGATERGAAYAARVAFTDVGPGRALSPLAVFGLEALADLDGSAPALREESAMAAQPCVCLLIPRPQLCTLMRHGSLRPAARAQLVKKAGLRGAHARVKAAGQCGGGVGQAAATSAASGMGRAAGMPGPPGVAAAARPRVKLDAAEAVEMWMKSLLEHRLLV